MPVSYAVVPETGILVIEARGAVSALDFGQMREELHAQGAPRPRLLVDLTGVSDFDVESSDIHRLARDMSGQELVRPGTRLAVVAKTEVGFGLARMYELLREGAVEEIRTFSDRDQAEAWLVRN